MKDTLTAIRKHKISDIFKEFGNSDITYNLSFKLAQINKFHSISYLTLLKIQ